MNRRRARNVLASALLGAVLAITPAVASAPEPSSKLVILGSAGGPVPRTKRSQPANALVINGSTYLIDVGDGVLTQMAKAKLNLGSIRIIFLTHQHIDHIADLPVVLVDRWLLTNKPGLDVYGPPGIQGLVSGVLGAFHPVELAPVSIDGPPKPPLVEAGKGQDLASGLNVPTLIYQDENVRVTAIGVDHYHYAAGSPQERFSRSYAYRFDVDGKSYVFSGDTGPSDRLATLAKGADILVCEVIDLDLVERLLRNSPGFTAEQVPGMMHHMEQDHLTGSEVGRIAAAAGVKMVVLSHLSPGGDEEVDPDVYLQGISQHFKGRVVVAQDLDSF